MRRRGRSLLRGLWVASLFALFGLLIGATSGANAQAIPYPQYSAIDANGVNLVTGALVVAAPGLSIGKPGAGGLAYSRTLNVTGAAGYQSNSTWRDSLSDGVAAPGSVNYTVVLQGSTHNFTLSGGVYTSLEGLGASLTYNVTSGLYTYTTRDGVIALFSTAVIAPVQVVGSTLVASVTSE